MEVLTREEIFINRAVERLEAGETCSVCTFTITADKQPTIFACGHIHCYGCALLVETCPICRGSVVRRYKVNAARRRMESVPLADVIDDIDRRCLNGLAEVEMMRTVIRRLTWLDEEFSETAPPPSDFEAAAMAVKMMVSGNTSARVALVVIVLGVLVSEMVISMVYMGFARIEKPPPYAYVFSTIWAGSALHLIVEMLCIKPDPDDVASYLLAKGAIGLCRLLWFFNAPLMIAGSRMFLPLEVTLTAFNGVLMLALHRCVLLSIVKVYRRVRVAAFR
jgi:hypothetical protein